MLEDFLADRHVGRRQLVVTGEVQQIEADPVAAVSFAIAFDHLRHDVEAQVIDTGPVDQPAGSPIATTEIDDASNPALPKEPLQEAPVFPRRFRIRTRTALRSSAPSVAAIDRSKRLGRGRHEILPPHLGSRRCRREPTHSLMTSNIASKNRRVGPSKGGPIEPVLSRRERIPALPATPRATDPAWGTLVQS